MGVASPINRLKEHEAFRPAIDLINEGRLTEAETILSGIVSNAKFSTAEKLGAFSHLIRIAAEQRSLDKLPRYIEEVKKFTLSTPDEKALFATCLQAIAVNWSYAANVTKSIETLEAAVSIAKELELKEDLFIYEYSLLEAKRVDGQYDTVLTGIQTLRQTAQESGDRMNVGLVFMLEGNVYRKTGRYHEAIETNHQAREIFSANKNSINYHYILWALGTCYAAIEDKEKAQIYLDLATSNFQGKEFERINIVSLLTLAELQTVIGEYEQAEATFKRAQDQAGPDDTSYFGRRLLRSQALLAIKKGEFDRANEMIDRLVILAVKEKNQKDLMRLRILKAEVLLRNGDSVQHEEARAMLQEALAFYQQRGVRRHQAVCLELLARLDSASGYPADALKKVEEMLHLAHEGSFERLEIRASLARFVLLRKLGESLPTGEIDALIPRIDRLNAAPERVILSRFKIENYDEWSQELLRLNSHAQRYVYEFFEDFHFIQNQSIDIEIDRNSHYVREKHLGEIPFHNKFTLMRILCLLAETPGKEFSKEQLAKEIWEQEYNPLRHDNNIYININRLRKLIEPNPRESRYVMNGSRGYYFNPAMKVNISSKISDVAPRATPKPGAKGEGARP